MERLGQKWKQLQAELGRSADACRDKYRELSAALQQTQGTGLAPLQLPAIGQVRAVGLRALGDGFVGGPRLGFACNM